MFTNPATRWRTAIFLAWAAGLSALLLLHRNTLLIRAGLWPLLLASLVMVLLFLGAMTLRPAERGGLHPALWLRGGLLLLPLLYMLPTFSQSPASGLGGYALEKRSLGDGGEAAPLPGELVATSGAAASAMPDGTQVTLSFLRFNLAQLAGKRVVVDGMVSRTASMPADRMMLFRFVVTCCVADATPVQVPVSNPAVGKFANDSWVRVRGVVKAREYHGRTVEVIEADRISPIPAPANPYLSP